VIELSDITRHFQPYNLNPLKSFLREKIKFLPPTIIIKATKLICIITEIIELEVKKPKISIANAMISIYFLQTFFL